MVPSTLPFLTDGSFNTVLSYRWFLQHCSFLQMFPSTLPFLTDGSFNTVLSSRWSSSLFFLPDGLHHCSFFQMVFITVLSSRWSSSLFFLPDDLHHCSFFQMVPSALLFLND
ncbi:hypothetical protein BsWGS_18242 [Bradybaena similaris]